MADAVNKTKMPKNVNLHRLTDLSNIETINEILLDTRPQIELHIISEVERTVIKFPFGNKIEIVDGCLIVHDSVALATNSSGI